MSISRPAVLQLVQCARRLGLAEGNAARCLVQRRFASSNNVTDSRISVPSEPSVHTIISVTSPRQSPQLQSCFPRAKRRFSVSTTAAHGHVEPPKPGEEYVFCSACMLLSESPLLHMLHLRKEATQRAFITDPRGVQNPRYIYRQGG